MQAVVTTYSVIVALGSVLASAGAVNAEEMGLKPSRQLLLEKSVPLTADSVNTQVIRVHFPPGYKTPLHTHEGPGPRYVLKGRLRVEDAGEIQVYGPGDVFWETGAAMTVENVGGSDAELVIFQLTAPR